MEWNEIKERKADDEVEKKCENIKESGKVIEVNKGVCASQNKLPFQLINKNFLPLNLCEIFC